ncbi:MAG: hypothetical protein WEE36_02620 [Acidimicrobiia bacterium]
MIPTVLVIAFLGAILWPTRAVLVVAATVVVWISLATIDGSVSSPAEFVGSAALGVANAAVGFAIGWALRRQISQWSLGD